MVRLICLFFCLLISSFSVGQTEIKTMFYNLLNFSSAPPANRTQILNTILSTYQPDLFMVCEVESQQDALAILNESFQYTSAPMTQSPFLFNTSGASLIHQVVYFDSDKFKLNYTKQIKTNVRSINHYSFELNTESNVPLEVFVAHFKASRGAENEAERLFEAQQLIDYLEDFPHSSNIILAGDFNMYSASEPAYQTLLNGTRTINLVDPINQPGSWNNNSSFSGIHTQSTRTSTVEFDGFGAGGGLDDRFDILLTSEVLTSATNDIAYIDNSYKAYGNNSNCFNNNINSLDCAGEFTQELRELLYQMSDHLPVVMSLKLNQEFLSLERFNQDSFVIFTHGNSASEKLELKVSPNLLSKNAQLFNALGHEVLNFDVSNLELSVDVSKFSTGLYFLKIEERDKVEKIYVSH